MREMHSTTRSAQMPGRENSYQIYEFEFVVDAYGRVWLLEVLRFFRLRICFPN